MIGIIVNPNSRKNRHKPSRVRRYQKIVGRHGVVVETPSVDSVATALERFAREGRRYWVADGGDGALHWMVNEALRYFGERAADMAVYVATGNGTIDFVARAIGLEGPAQEVLARLAAHVAAGREVPTVPVSTVAFEGHQTAYGDARTPWRRLGFGNALAGYGANFFGPLYRGNKEYGASRIATLLATAFAAGAGRAAFSGPLAALRPEALARAEREFLRPLRAEVRIDGEALRGADGAVVREHTVLHVASVPVNLADILRVFPMAGGGRLHVHAGHVSASEMARIFPLLVTGRSVQHMLDNAHDGVATRLDVLCEPGEEMTPVLDGEVFHRVTELHATVGPTLRIARP